LFVFMCCPSWVILCLFTPSFDCVYALPVLSYFVFVHAKYWLCIYVARLELFCVCARQVLIMYMCCPSWVILCLFTPSIDYVFALPVLCYFVFVHAKYWWYICVARLVLFLHKITQDGQRIYTTNTRREQTQHNSRRATYIHNQYLAWTNTKRRATYMQNQF
jgi:hypothetical protein